MAQAKSKTDTTPQHRGDTSAADEFDPVVLRFKRLRHGDELPLPAYQSTGASGLDVRAAEAMTIPAGQRRLVPTGFAIDVPAGFEVQVRPRSGLALAHGVTVLNAPGTIDADYRGEVFALLLNTSLGPFKVERGQRIAQLVVQPVFRVEVEETDELSETERGAAGFGSTGKA